MLLGSLLEFFFQLMNDKTLSNGFWQISNVWLLMQVAGNAGFMSELKLAVGMQCAYSEISHIDILLT